MPATQRDREPTLLPVKPGTLSHKDKLALSKAGVIVIEHENPAELRLLRPYAEIDSSTMLRCALQALTAVGNVSTGAYQREVFTKAVAAALVPEDRK